MLPRLLQPSPRSDDTVQSHGVLNLASTGDHASGESINTWYTLGRSPFVALNTLARRSTSAGGGSIGDKMPGELAGNVLRGRGRGGEIVQYRKRLLFAGLIVLPVHDRPCSRLVQRLAKHELSGRGGIIALGTRTHAAHRADAPAGQRTGELGHVVLVVAAAHAERMQLHDLAGEVLVQAGLAVRMTHGGAFGRRAIGADRARLIEEDLHGRMTFDRDQHVLETAEHVRADCFGFERAGKHRHGRLFHRYREMVRPENHQPFDERCRRLQARS